MKEWAACVLFFVQYKWDFIHLVAGAFYCSAQALTSNDLLVYFWPPDGHFLHLNSYELLNVYWKMRKKINAPFQSSTLCSRLQTFWYLWQIIPLHPFAGLTIVATSLGNCQLCASADCTPMVFHSTPSLIYPFDAFIYFTYLFFA